MATTRAMKQKGSPTSVKEGGRKDSSGRNDSSGTSKVEEATAQKLLAEKEYYRQLAKKTEAETKLIELEYKAKTVKVYKNLVQDDEAYWNHNKVVAAIPEMAWIDPMLYDSDATVPLTPQKGRKSG